MEAPTPDEVRRALAQLDQRQQKIVGGLLTVMIKDPERVRESEWIAERLMELTLLSGDCEDASPEACVQAVGNYLKAHSGELLKACLLLFQRVALDLAPGAAGFSFEEAVRRGLEYLPAAGGRPKRPRDLGEQPLARLMAERGLKPRDLVAASGEQLSHKMVARAMQGRRLTVSMRAKVLRAWNLAAASDSKQSELFDYVARLRE